MSGVLPAELKVLVNQIFLFKVDPVVNQSVSAANEYVVQCKRDSSSGNVSNEIYQPLKVLKSCIKKFTLYQEIPAVEVDPPRVALLIHHMKVIRV